MLSSRALHLGVLGLGGGNVDFDIPFTANLLTFNNNKKDFSCSNRLVAFDNKYTSLFTRHLNSIPIQESKPRSSLSNTTHLEVLFVSTSSRKGFFSCFKKKKKRSSLKSEFQYNKRNFGFAIKDTTRHSAFSGLCNSMPSLRCVNNCH